MKKIIAIFTTLCMFALAVMSIDGLSVSPIEDETTQAPVPQSAQMVNMTEADNTTTAIETTEITTTETQTTEVQTTVEETITKKAKKKKKKVKKKKVEVTKKVETTKAPVNYNNNYGSDRKTYVPSTKKPSVKNNKKEEIKKWKSNKERLEWRWRK